MTVHDRFWEKVDIGYPDECWEWQAYCDNWNGYGRFNFHGEIKNASRVAWTLTHGDPGNLNVLHKCDNPPCVNPKHLYTGTQEDNINDAVERSGLHENRRTARAKLSTDEVRQIRERLDRGDPQRDIAADFGVVVSTISDINTGVTWSDV